MVASSTFSWEEVTVPVPAQNPAAVTSLAAPEVSAVSAKPPLPGTSLRGPVQRRSGHQRRNAAGAVPLSGNRRPTRAAEQPASTVSVSQRPGRVEVRGAALAEVEQALTLTRRLQRVVTTPGSRARTGLVELFTELGSTLPPPSVIQVQRGAEHRRDLLASGYFTHETLGLVRDARLASSTRTWVSRQRAAHRLVTVSHQKQTVIPAFLFTADGAPRGELQPLIAELDTAGIAPWQAWTWLVSTTPLLSGCIPEQVARVDPGRARTAAHRFAERLHRTPAA